MKNIIPLVRVAPIHLFVNFLEEVGTPIETLLKQWKISTYAFEDDNLSISCHQAFNFIHDAALQQGISNLGLLVAERNSFNSLGILGRMTTQCLTLYDAILTAIYVGRFFNSCERFWLIERGSKAYLCQEFVYVKELMLDHACYFSLRMMLNLIQIVAGKSWYPKKISLQTNFSNFVDNPLSEVEINRSVAINSIEFPRDFLSLPLPTSTHKFSLEEEYHFLFKTAPPSLFSQRLALVIIPFLKEGYLTLEMVSGIIRITPRTIQRRLAKEGLTYDKLLEQIRYKKAMELLQDKKAKIIDIAYELGYKDPSHFTRAFKRWTGKTPKEFKNFPPNPLIL